MGSEEGHKQLGAIPLPASISIPDDSDKIVHNLYLHSSHCLYCSESTPILPESESGLFVQSGYCAEKLCAMKPSLLWSRQQRQRPLLAGLAGICVEELTRPFPWAQDARPLSSCRTGAKLCQAPVLPTFNGKCPFPQASITPKSPFLSPVCARFLSLFFPTTKHLSDINFQQPSTTTPHHLPLPFPTFVPIYTDCNTNQQKQQQLEQLNTNSYSISYR